MLLSSDAYLFTICSNLDKIKIQDKKRFIAMLEKPQVIIQNTLTKELGYNIWTKVIDAQHFVPQHRERIVIVGFLDDVNFTWDNLNLPPKGAVRLSSILHPEDGTENPEGHFTLGEHAVVNAKYTLSPKLWNYLKDYAERHKAKGNSFGFGLFLKQISMGIVYYDPSSKIENVSSGRPTTQRRSQFRVSHENLPNLYENFSEEDCIDYS